MDASLSEESRRLRWHNVRALETKLSPSDSSEQISNFQAITERLKVRIAETITTFTSSSGGESKTVNTETTTTAGLGVQ